MTKALQGALTETQHELRMRFDTEYRDAAIESSISDPMNDGISPTPGWKLVPVEPTPEMVEAACSTADNGKFSGEYLRDILRAVFAAAPTSLQAEMQKPDQVHLADNDGQAKSLQPLLDAQWVQRLRETADHLRENSLSLAKYPGMADEARARELAALHIAEIADTYVAIAALGNRTPALAPITEKRLRDLLQGAAANYGDRFFRDDPFAELVALYHAQSSLPAPRIEGEALHALRLILPMAKGYAAVHDVGSNAEYIAQAERALAAESVSAPLPVQGQDEVMDALKAYANIHNWDVDAQGIRRVWLEPNSFTPSAYNGFELAAAALRASSAPTTKQGD